MEFALEGNIADIVADPIKWGEEQVENAILQHQEHYFEAKQLGKSFWDEITNRS